MEKEQAQLKNVQLMWANLIKKSKMSDKFQVDLVNLDKQQVGMLEAIGLTVRDGKKESKAIADPEKAADMAEKGMWITAKSNYSPFPNNAYDGRDGAPKGTLFPAELATGYLNGTIAHVQVCAYGWGQFAKTGNELSCGLNKLKILTLKDEGGGGDPFDSEMPGGDPF